MKTINETEKMLDTATAARMLGVTPAYLRLCAQSGKIDYYNPLGSTKYVFKMADVLAALKVGAGPRKRVKKARKLKEGLC